MGRGFHAQFDLFRIFGTAAAEPRARVHPCRGSKHPAQLSNRRAPTATSLHRRLMEWDGARPLHSISRSLNRSASRPRSASPGRHTYYAGDTHTAPTVVSSLHAPTASSRSRSRYADRAAASYHQRPLYGTAVQGHYRDGAYETTHHTPQVVGYQEVPVYEQLVHREVRVPYEVEVPVPYEVERLVEVR